MGLVRIMWTGAGVLLGMGLVMVGPTPAGAAAAAPLTFEFQDGCGTVDILVTNATAAPVEYQLARTIEGEPLAPVTFTAPPTGTQEHRWIVGGGQGVRATSALLTDPVFHEFDAGDQGCASEVPRVRWIADCRGKVLLEVTNRWSHPLKNLAFSRGDDIGARFSVASKMWHHELFTDLHEGEPLGVYWAMESPGRPLVQWSQVIYRKHISCDWTPPVSLTPTCDGVHVVTTNTEKRSTLIIRWRASFTHFDEVRFEMAQGNRLDVHVPLPRDGEVWAGWEQTWDPNGAGGPVGGLMIRNKAKDCAAAAPVNGPGQLPVTGTQVGLMAIAGAVLLALGTTLVALTRRRRTVA